MWEGFESGYPTDRQQLAQQLSWLVILRLIFMGVLAMATLISHLRGESTLLGPSVWVLWSLILASVLASFIFFLIKSTISPQRYPWLAGVQLIWDVFFTTGVVYATGSLNSIFTPLYCVNITMGGIVLGKRFGYLMGSVCTVFYSSLLAFEYHGVLPALLAPTPYLAYLDPAKIFTTIFWNMGLFNVVAYLIGYFGERLRIAQNRVAQGEKLLESLEDLNTVILENVTSGIITIDAQGTVIRFNQAAASMLLGICELREGKTIGEILPNSAARILQMNPTGGGMRKDILSWEQSVAGRYLVISASSLRGRGFVLALQDLTSFREMEEQVKKSDRLAAVGKLAAAMAHEIRNPLASISGSIEILQGESQLESNRRLMGIVLRETERLNNLIGDFLDFARPTPPLLEEVNLYGLVEETVTLFGSQQEKVKISVSGDRGLWIRGDSSQLRQVLWNLLKNAQEAISEHGAVELRFGRLSGEGRVYLEVSDNGKGVPAEHREKIFDPFFTTKPRGSGLGLATVAKIVAAHQGSIDVQPRVESGVGATFRLFFPEVGPR